MGAEPKRRTSGKGLAKSVSVYVGVIGMKNLIEPWSAHRSRDFFCPTLSAPLCSTRCRIRLNPVRSAKAQDRQRREAVATICSHIHFCPICNDLWTCVCWLCPEAGGDLMCKDCREKQGQTTEAASPSNRQGGRRSLPLRVATSESQNEATIRTGFTRHNTSDCHVVMYQRYILHHSSVCRTLVWH